MRYEIFSNNSFSPLKISAIGFSRDTQVTKFGPGQFSSYVIHYITKGKGYYNGNAVCEGQGFLIYPGCSEEYHSDPSDPWEYLWIISRDEKMNEIFKKYDIDTDRQIFDYNSASVLKELSCEIIFNNNKILDSMQLLELFLKILNSHTLPHISRHDKSNSEIYLDFCVQYIQTNIHQKVTVEELQNLIGVSQPYLYKIFMDKFNMSTKQYITQSRLNKAKELLNETNMSVTEIANSVGYSDILAFSKAFSHNEKMSPMKYRARGNNKK